MDNVQWRTFMLKAGVLWWLGVPISVIILLFVFGVL